MLITKCYQSKELPIGHWVAAELVAFGSTSSINLTGDLVVHKSKAKQDAPLNFQFIGEEVELAVSCDGGNVGLVLSGLSHLFTVATDAGEFKAVNSVRIGVKDEVAKEFLYALSHYARTLSKR